MTIEFSAVGRSDKSKPPKSQPSNATEGLDKTHKKLVVQIISGGKK